MSETRKKLKGKFWVGCTDGEICFYADDYYNGVLRADLFRSRAAARRCYRDVRRIAAQELRGPRP